MKLTNFLTTILYIIDEINSAQFVDVNEYDELLAKSQVLENAQEKWYLGHLRGKLVCLRVRLEADFLSFQPVTW